MPIGLNGEHAPGLDGIRGIAILLVFAFHFGVGASLMGVRDFFFIDWAMQGWVGVDLFFVLSGYLITGILYDSRNSANYFSQFYIRRALRIFPLYYLVLALCFAWSLTSATDKISSNGFEWPALFLTNIAISATGDWLTAPEIASHYWSLAVEEHFYLIWPAVVLWGGSRRSLMVITLCVIAGVLGVRFLMTLGAAQDAAYFTFTLARADSLAIGAFCALLMRRPSGAPNYAMPAFIVMVASVIAVVVIAQIDNGFTGNERLGQRLSFTLISLGFAGFLVFTLCSRTLGGILSWTPLRVCGRYSYGAYVWHYPLYMVLIEHRAADPAFASMKNSEIFMYVGGVALLCAALAVASYHLFEKPFLRLKDRFAPKAPPQEAAGQPA